MAAYRGGVTKLIAYGCAPRLDTVAHLRAAPCVSSMVGANSIMARKISMALGHRIAPPLGVARLARLALKRVKLKHAHAVELNGAAQHMRSFSAKTTRDLSRYILPALRAATTCARAASACNKHES